ncbi:hypothetical protein AB1K70_14350 [Bremerella sp. JC770]|uniref:hypothetical protein n=1 Tax=Bremerella sp. JC770 TaxID=3232137 RepID=UPI003457B4F9
MRSENLRWRALGLLICLSGFLSTGVTAVGEQPTEGKFDTSTQPKFPEMEVSLTIIGYQGKNFPEGRGKGTSGCSTGFDPKTLRSAKVNGQFTCGFPGEVSRVNWWYLGTDQKGDHYEFARQFPYEDLDQRAPRKKVVFRGKPVVVYEEESHRIVLRERERKQESEQDKTR